MNFKTKKVLCSEKCYINTEYVGILYNTVECVIFQEATTENLTEILNKLSPEELAEFRFLIEFEKDFSYRSMHQLASTQALVELMVKRDPRGCIDMTRKILKKMHWTDLTESSKFSIQTKGEAKLLIFFFFLFLLIFILYV